MSLPPAVVNPAAPSRGRWINTGNGPLLQPIDIGHRDYVALLQPDTAFWSLIPRNQLADALAPGSRLLNAWHGKARRFAAEMHTLRFDLKPSAVYFNPTERCNLNCTYCYLPQAMRHDGRHMSRADIFRALKILKPYFARTVPKPTKPQIVFHGAEPLLNAPAMFAAIDAFADDFRFGVQTNGTLLDDAAVEFLTRHGASIGLSLDAPTAAIADRTRKTWGNRGVYQPVLQAMERLKGYPGWSVICTISSENLRHLTRLVEFFHQHRVPTCLLNILRCTLPSARGVRPADHHAARYFLAALDRTYELYRQSGRKLPVANFANILLAILAPTARRMMCDISPCGGGRCFFALAANGDLFPCSEFIGLPRFRGGNIFTDRIDRVLESEPFQRVTTRRVEDLDPCRRCAIRHFCGAPCPAEAHEMNGAMNRPGAFCEFYEEQVRYALRVIADDKADAYLWDDWDQGLRDSFHFS